MVMIKPNAALGIVLCLILQAFAFEASEIHLPVEKVPDQANSFLQENRIVTPKIGLVLSGGGARGLAHIGVLKVLEKEDIAIGAIVGTSIGSVVGGLYACGYSAKEIEQIALTQDWSNLLSDTPSRTSLFATQKAENVNHILEFWIKDGRPVIPSGLTGGQLLIQKLTELTLEADYHSRGDYDRLRVPFRAVALDVVTGKRVVIRKGPLAEAMRASFAVPIAFTPVDKDSMLLIDGGMSGDLPADVAREMGCAFVIGVDTKAPLRRKDQINNPLQLLDQIVSLAIQKQTRESPDPADILITPELGIRHSMEFEGIQDLILQGEIAAKKALPALRNAMGATAIAPSPTPKGVLAALRADGLRSLPEDSVLQLAGLAIGQKIDSLSTFRALKALFDTGIFAETHFRVEGTKDSVSLLVAARENPQWRPVVIENATRFDAEELARLCGFPENGIINVHEFQKRLAAIRQHYRDSGLALASIDGIDTTNNHIVVRISEGIVRHIEFKGNDRTRSDVIRRECAMREGQVFSLPMARASLRQIYSTNLFEQVLLEVKPGVKLVFHVKEKDPDRIQVGFHYDEARLGEGFGRYVRENLMGTGNRWVLHLQYGLRREKYTAAIQGDRLGGSYLSHQAKAYMHRDKKQMVDDAIPNQFQIRTLQKIGLSFGLGQQIQRLGHASVVLRTENFISDTLDRQWVESNLRDFSKGVRTISFNSDVDDLDRVPFPRSGRRHHFGVDFAHNIIGGTESFVNFVGTVGAYLTPWTDHTLHPRIQIAYADKELPIVEKHSLGGYSDMLTKDDISFYDEFPFMGYQKLSFSGDCLALLNLSYRWRVLPNMYISLKYDIGNTWERSIFELTRDFAQNELQHLKQGMGLGLLFDTPVGPIALMGAQALNAETNYDQAQRQLYYVSIGHEF